MAKVVTPVTARVEVIGKLKESSFQEGQYYRSVLFLDLSQPPGSEAAKIWKSLSESECEGLVKGAIVQLVPAGKTPKGEDRHNIVLTDAQTPSTVASTPAPQASGWTPEEKRAIAAKVSQYSDLMAYCLQVADQRFGELMKSEESIRCLATTIFLATIRN